MTSILLAFNSSSTISWWPFTAASWRGVFLPSTQRADALQGTRYYLLAVDLIRVGLSAALERFCTYNKMCAQFMTHCDISRNILPFCVFACGGCFYGTLTLRSLVLLSYVAEALGASYFEQKSAVQKKKSHPLLSGKFGSRPSTRDESKACECESMHMLVGTHHLGIAE